MRHLMIFALFCVLGCSPEAESGPRLGDAGSGADAAAPPDAGAAPDAAVMDVSTTDVGTAEAGVVVPDAGMAGDAAVVLPGDAGSVAGDAGDGMDAGAIDYALLHGQVFDSMSNDRYSGVRVCVRGRGMSFPCVTTGADGVYSLRVPHDENIVVVWSAGLPAVFPALMHINVSVGRNRWNLALLRASTIPLLGQLVQTPIDASKGQVTFTAGDDQLNGASGVRASLSPMSGVGPIYLGNNRFPDLAMTATGTLGTGFFVNVNPGTARVGGTSPNHTCAPWELGVNVGGNWEVPVVAGHMSVVVFRCQPR
jgi:hypothetical protein